MGNARNNNARLTDRLNVGVAILRAMLITALFYCKWDSATESDSRKYVKSEVNIQLLSTCLVKNFIINTDKSTKIKTVIH